MLTQPYFWSAVVLVLAYYAINLIIRTRHVLQGSRVAKVAAITLDALRQARPNEYPTTRHKWGTSFGTNGKRKPVLCAECTDDIKPYIGGSVVRRCINCGVAAHDGCLKRVKDCCKPVCTESTRQPHFWLVSGTTYNDAHGVGHVDQEEKVKICMYCGHDVKGGVLAVEPSWFCGLCFECTHVKCFLECHPELKTVEKAYQKAIKKIDARRKYRFGNRRHGKSKSFDVGSLSLGVVNGDEGPWHELEVGMDQCSMGPMRFFALPSIAVVAKQNPTQRGEQIDSPKLQNSGSQLERLESIDSKFLETKTAFVVKKQKVTKRRKVWWRRVFASHSLDWSKWEIIHTCIPSFCIPVLVLVNVRSGPQVGKKVRNDFSRALNPLQIVTLPKNDPKEALKTFSLVPRLRVVCIGGDGTIGWSVSCLEEIEREYRSLNQDWVLPPLAVLPVGTGNDMARCLGWGTGYSAWKDKGVLGSLAEVLRARPTKVDRWELAFTVHKPKDSFMDKALHMISPSSKIVEDETVTHKSWKYMNNYIGVGVDAKVALEFHGMRDSHPEWFQSQFGNKLVYTSMGALDVVGVMGNQHDLSSKVTLWCDGRQMGLPPGSQGVMVVNIGSYMGGVNVWERSDGKIPKSHSSMDDGLLEVVAVYGSFHLGKLQVGLSRAVRVAQASEIELITSRRLAMQIDGEPFMQEECTIHIKRHCQITMLSPS